MDKDYRRLWNSAANTIDKARAIRTLAEILADEEGKAFVSRLELKEAELCIELLGLGIAKHILETAERDAFIVALKRLAEYYGRLPRSMMIADNEVKIPVPSGSSGTRMGSYKGQTVVVKTFRVAEQDNFQKIRKRFCKEVVLWGMISHPNILRFVGVKGDMAKGQFVTVSEWMARGNIMDYIRKNTANRLDLLRGAAQGLDYLHDVSLTHGDIKGANILMSDDMPPRPCLADFGFMAMILDLGLPMSHGAQLEGGTMTFMSPELLVPPRFGLKDSVPTPEADTYAFGLVIFQVLTGEIPFRGVKQSELGWSVVKGQRPTKPANASSIGFTDSLWDFTQRCWDGDPKLRPRTAEVATHLGREAAAWVGLMPPCAPAENIVLRSEEPTSDALECHGNSSSLNALSEHLTESQATSGPSRRGTASTQSTELSQEQPPAVTTVRSEEPQSDPQITARPQSEGPEDRPNIPGIQTRFERRYSFMPQLSPEVGKSFSPFRSKFRGLFGTKD